MSKRTAAVVFETGARGDRSGSFTPYESNCLRRPASLDLERNSRAKGVAMPRRGSGQSFNCRRGWRLLSLMNSSRLGTSRTCSLGVT